MTENLFYGGSNANILNVPDGVLISILRFTVSEGFASDAFEFVSCIINESNIKFPPTNLKSGYVEVVFKPSSAASNGGDVSVGGQHN